MRYRYRIEERKEKRLRFVKLLRRLAILSLLFITFYTFFLYMGGRPQLSEESLKSLSLIPLEKRYLLQLNRPVKEVRLYAEQGGKNREIYSVRLPEPSKEVSFTLKAKELGLKEGEVNLTLELSSGFLQKKTYFLKALVDTLPPRFSLLAYTPTLSPGSTFAMKVKVEEEAQVLLVHGEHRYGFYPVGSGYHFGLFPVRLDLVEAQSFRVEVRDRAGNFSFQNLPLRLKEVKFKEDRINIDENFINRVIYPLLGEEGKGLAPLEAFRRVNELWRARDAKKLEEIGRRSEPRVLWEGAFLQLPNSKVFANYGDLRHYLYQGQKVSESRHMGFDFASLERAPVPASNSGVVVYTGWLGIYGNTVILDHGMGLMSLYGHLSEVGVKEGQFVKKGEIIGRTGATGLALGDHLHFGLLVQGYEVNPLHWLDQKWVKSHIISVLEAR
ncbi:MAG: M23 family metallopeptidase [Aquificaceae bacterium]|nr:M23 family metallopeptidase [Aquificaceae bacterium]